MTDHSISTSAGPVTVQAQEPIPGLHVYEVPAGVSVNSGYRWILAHHEGHALASFETQSAAVGAAEKVGPFADWTDNVMTTANRIGPGGMEELMSLLTAAGGQHPNA